MPALEPSTRECDRCGTWIVQLRTSSLISVAGPAAPPRFKRTRLCGPCSRQHAAFMLGDGADPIGFDAPPFRPSPSLPGARQAVAVALA